MTDRIAARRVSPARHVYPHADVPDLERLLGALRGAFADYRWRPKFIGDPERGLALPFGADTKVLSTLFERDALERIRPLAQELGYLVSEPDRQNAYPDVTLLPERGDGACVALDVKSSYRRADGTYEISLGAWRGPIAYPAERYGAHLVVAFLYERVEGSGTPVPMEQAGDIWQPVREQVHVIVQEKWRIAGTRHMAGNVENIGAVTTLAGLRDGTGPFSELGEAVFVRYWNDYLSPHRARERGVDRPYGDLEGFLAREPA